MTPNFALTLSHQGVALLQRAPRGWLLVGEVALDDPAMDASLAALRATALSMAPEGLATKLVIPQSEILYTDLPSPGPDPLVREAAIREALVGVTPYPVDRLAFDWSGSGDRLRVAVVARQTLEEAEAFADAHGFDPVSFVARPEDGQFLGEPFFGLAARLGPAAQVERDVVAVTVSGRAERPAAEVKPIFARSASVSAGAVRPEFAADVQAPQDGDSGTAPGDAEAVAPVDGVGKMNEPKVQAVRTFDAAHATSVPEQDPAATAPATAEATRDTAPAEAPRDGETSAAKAEPEPPRSDPPSASEPAGPDSARAAQPSAPSVAAPMAPAPSSSAPQVCVEGHNQPPQRVAPIVEKAGSAPDKRLGKAATDGPAPAAPALAEVNRADPAGWRRPGSGARIPVPEKSEVAQSPRNPAPAIEAPPADLSAAVGKPLAAGAAVTLATLKERSRQPLAVDGSASEAEAMTVFGARKRPSPHPRPSTGLVVTGALALVLAAVGVWAAVFLPESDRSAALAPDTGEAAALAGSDLAVEQATADTLAEVTAADPEAPVPFNVDEPIEPVTADADSAEDPVRAAADSRPGRAPTDAPDGFAQPTPDAVEALGLAPRPLGPDDLHQVRLEEMLAPADAPDAPTGPRLPNLGAPPPDIETVLGGVTDMPAEGGREVTGQPPEQDVVVEVRTGAPDIVPDLRRTLRSRHLLLEGGIAVPADAEPLPRPPGLGGDGTLRTPPDVPLSGPASSDGTEFATASAEPSAAEGQQGRDRLTSTGEDLGSAPMTAAPQTGGQTGEADPAAEPEVEVRNSASLWAPRAVADYGQAGIQPDALARAVGAPERDRAAAIGASLAAGDRTADPASVPEAQAEAAAETILALPSTGLAPRARPSRLSIPPGPTHLVIQSPAAADPRPPLRPGSIVDLAAAAEARLASATEQAVAASPLPGVRPSDFGAVVARARAATTPATATAAAATSVAAAATPPASAAATATAPSSPAVAAPTAPVAQAPSLPTRASVAQQATETRAINLRRVNLIGVFGTSSQRRALVRLSNGQIAAVRVGDRLDGGQVAAIGDNELRYVRNGRNTVLRIGG